MGFMLFVVETAAEFRAWECCATWEIMFFDEPYAIQFSVAAPPPFNLLDGLGRDKFHTHINTKDLNPSGWKYYLDQVNAVKLNMDTTANWSCLRQVQIFGNVKPGWYLGCHVYDMFEEEQARIMDGLKIWFCCMEFPTMIVIGFGTWFGRIDIETWFLKHWPQRLDFVGLAVRFILLVWHWDLIL